MTQLSPQPRALTNASVPPTGRRVLVAWVLILVNAAFFIYRASTFREAAQSGQRVANLQLELTCRYAVGCKAVFTHAASMSPTNLGLIATQARAKAKTPLDHLRIIPVIAELKGNKAGADEAAEFLRESPPDNLIADATALQKAYRGGGLDAAQGQRLGQQYGWYGNLAASQFAGPGNSVRASVESAAIRTVIVFISATVLGGIFLLAGISLSIIFLINWLNGKLPPQFLSADQIVSDAMLEGFAVYLCLMTAIMVGERLLPAHPGLAWNFLLVAPVVSAVGWVRYRGISGAQFAMAVGWNRGRGILREMFAGVVGYITGLPLLAAGMAVFLFLSTFTPTKATHPIEYEIQAGGWARAGLLFLACVFAPIAEELVFRGMLLRHLTLRRSWFFSAVIVSIIFAAIHPQGWTAIPLLGAVGLVLALIRIQRDSLVASMTAHALNNFMVMMLVILAIS